MTCSQPHSPCPVHVRACVHALVSQLRVVANSVHVKQDCWSRAQPRVITQLHVRM
jgi:hypothetical protein